MRDDDEMIDKVTKKKIPKGRAEILRGSHQKSNKKGSLGGSIDKSHSRGGGSSLKGSSRRLP